MRKLYVLWCCHYDMSCCNGNIKNTCFEWCDIQSIVIKLGSDTSCINYLPPEVNLNRIKYQGPWLHSIDLFETLRSSWWSWIFKWLHKENNYCYEWVQLTILLLGIPLKEGNGTHPLCEKLPFEMTFHWKFLFLQDLTTCCLVEMLFSAVTKWALAVDIYLLSS